MALLRQNRTVEHSQAAATLPDDADGDELAPTASHVPLVSAASSLRGGWLSEDPTDTMVNVAWKWAAGVPKFRRSIAAAAAMMRRMVPSRRHLEDDRDASRSSVVAVDADIDDVDDASGRKAAAPGDDDDHHDEEDDDDYDVDGVRDSNEDTRKVSSLQHSHDLQMPSAAPWPQQRERRERGTEHVEVTGKRRRDGLDPAAALRSAASAPVGTWDDETLPPAPRHASAATSVAATPRRFNKWGNDAVTGRAPDEVGNDMSEDMWSEHLDRGRTKKVKVAADAAVEAPPGARAPAANVFQAQYDRQQMIGSTGVGGRGGYRKGASSTVPGRSTEPRTQRGRGRGGFGGGRGRPHGGRSGGGDRHSCRGSGRGRGGGRGGSSQPAFRPGGPRGGGWGPRNN